MCEECKFRFIFYIFMSFKIEHQLFLAQLNLTNIKEFTSIACLVSSLSQNLGCWVDLKMQLENIGIDLESR